MGAKNCYRAWHLKASLWVLWGSSPNYPDVCLIDMKWKKYWVMKFKIWCWCVMYDGRCSMFDVWGPMYGVRCRPTMCDVCLIHDVQVDHYLAAFPAPIYSNDLQPYVIPWKSSQSYHWSIIPRFGRRVTEVPFSGSDIHTRYIPSAAAPDSRDRNRCTCLLGRSLVREKADRCWSQFSSPDLKALRDTESMMCWGRRFHRQITRLEKKCRLESRRHLCLVILTVWVAVMCMLSDVTSLLTSLLYVTIDVTVDVTIVNSLLYSCKPRPSACKHHRIV